MPFGGTDPSTCTTCDGDGYEGDELCSSCFGLGTVDLRGSAYHTLKILATINNVVNISNIFDSYKILEAIDSTEYDALTDAQKDGVKTLLSCGRVDLNEGKIGRVRLWNWFGAESTTVANLTALLV